MAKSKISWTEATWNPVAGCTKVSPGCDNCYAERMAYRLANMGQKKYQQVISTDGGVWNNKVFCDEKALDIPLHWKKPRMILINSMSDTFHPKVPFEFIDKMFAVMALCPQHTFQVLTKRPERMLEWINIPYQHVKVVTAIKNQLRNTGQVVLDDTMTIDWPLPNVHLGTTCENQEWADKRIPTLLQIPAAVRFISAEPMLGEINFFHIATEGGAPGYKMLFTHWNADTEKLEPFDGLPEWLIIGAESIGSHPGRECKIEWVRNIVRQCKAAGMAVFVKQIHMWLVDGSYEETIERARQVQSISGTKIKRVLVKDITKFPIDLRIREYPK